MSGEDEEEEERYGCGLYTYFEDGFWLWRLLVDALSGEHTVVDLVARLRNES